MHKMETGKTVAFTKNSTNIFFHILTKCNLRCTHCYINKKEHGDAILPAETVIKWLKAFGQKTGQANVIFLGGEPTLHPDLAYFVKTAKDMGFLSVTIDTNGYLFHDILSKVLPGEVDYISFSLDGPEKETNDKIRGKGSYDTCTANIKKAKDKGFKTSLIYTVSRANIDGLSMMPPLLKNLGIDRFFIQVTGIRGESAKKKGKVRVSKEKWLDIVPEIAAEAAKAGIFAIYPKIFLDNDEVFECAGLCADNYFIFPNGRVYKCPLCEDFPLHALKFENNMLVKRPPLNEEDLFGLNIPEGCVMNRLIQPDNLAYGKNGKPEYKVACCMLKNEIFPGRRDT